MGIYKNDYTKEEDELLWELHEIRHNLHKKLKKKTITKTNNDAMKKYLSWKMEKSEQHEKRK